MLYILIRAYIQSSNFIIFYQNITDNKSFHTLCNEYHSCSGHPRRAAAAAAAAARCRRGRRRRCGNRKVHRTPLKTQDVNAMCDIFIAFQMVRFLPFCDFDASNRNNTNHSVCDFVIAYLL